MPINSRLWKAAQLALHSAYFPKMVQAACWVQDKPYTPAVLYDVATKAGIVNALSVEPDGSIDESLLQVMIDNGATLDQAIMDAVNAHVPPQTVWS